VPQILIYTPDGQKRPVALDAARTTLGRSSSADLCFADDNGLSRLHLEFERSGGDVIARDLNSKNGTLVNGERLADPVRLRPNDKLSCGHLLIVFEPPSRSAGVIFIDDDTARTEAGKIVTSLHGVMDESTKGVGSAAQVSALIRAGNELASERPLPDLFRIILDLSIDAVSAGRGVVLTSEGAQLVERASRGDNFSISRAVRDQVMETKLSVLVRDTSLDDALKSRKSIIASRVRTLMAVPLQVRDQVMGLIYVDSPSLHREFTKDDLSLLTVMANVAAIRIEHARLAELEQARKVMEHELRQAEAIQRGALPSAPPSIPGLDLAGYNAASRSVGGDYYDFFTDNTGQAALILADVSGKGMPAALMVMALQARVQPLFESLPVAPGALKIAMDRLNRLTTANCPLGRFITLFACVLDGKSGRFVWSCAGHNPPLIIRSNGTRELLEGGGPIMGVFEDADYEQEPAELAPGDVLAIYSDGVTEACSSAEEEFDMDRLAKVLIDNRRKTADEIAKAVAQAVQEWTCGAPPTDDITVVIAKRV
jgi:serine phosphatase RsbU (regulator of sigma subunit)/pSer/pThr/pTyr-binding forkhead associated (FHA) protein